MLQQEARQTTLLHLATWAQINNFEGILIRAWCLSAIMPNMCMQLTCYKAQILLLKAYYMHNDHRQQLLPVECLKRCKITEH